MLVRHWLALLSVGSAATFLSAGCALESADDDEDAEISVGDGVAVDELVAERQLNGSELPLKTLTLTFDDGPGRRTIELADYLAERGIHATFFINGAKVAGRQGALDTIVGRGHLLANHTQNHKQLTALSGATIVKEITETDDLIAQVQPDGPWVIRAPFGAWNAGVSRAVNASPMSKYVGSVFWDQGGTLTQTSAADWDCWGKGVSVQRCGDLYMTEIRAKKRGIVLMHDIHDKTVEMVKYIVPKLIEEGYAFAPLEEVPSVKRALASADEVPKNAKQCSSATLGRYVDENVCVQSRINQRWSRCVDGEWMGSTGPGDAKCIERFPLQQN